MSEAAPPEVPLPTPRPNRTYLDTETTGLVAKWNEIIEIAFVVEEIPEDPQKVGKILSTFSTKVRPLHIGSSHPKALEINGYNAKDWEGAPTFAEIADTVEGYLKGAGCLVGQNPKFDTEFIREAFRREGKLQVFIPYHQIDTVTSAYEAWNWTGEGPGLSLDKIRKHLGWTVHPNHSALQDALDCRRVLYAAREALTGIRYVVD